ncbi:hypothetical protein IQ255_24320 [Pleurocapsales cyanobacterium LEGE 10410]|nr:hypothetical protein [Pleurocapsales cyanobacterium LEGE 10410]
MMSQIKHLSTAKILPLSLILLLFPLSSCRVEQEQAGRLPDVEVEPGRLPEFDIEGPDVDIGVTERTVTVPKVVVVQEEETIEVPYIDVDVPGAERTERTLTVEAEVPSSGYNLEIQDVYVINNELWVVSQLEEVNPNAPQATVRASDRIAINAPDMAVRHYIVGERPIGTFNEQYTFVGNREQIAPQLESGRQLYGQQQQAGS